MIHTLLALACLLLVPAGRPAAAEPSEAHKEFHEMDGDKNGRLSKEEFTRWYPVKVWKDVDKNGDDEVGVVEYVPVREGLSQHRRREARDAEAK